MPTIPEALAIAIQHHQAGRVGIAAQIYRQILAVQPNHLTACHNLGAALLAQGNWDEAAARFRRALELSPSDVDSANNLGSALQAQGKLDEAVACYRQVLARDPHYVDAHSNLAAVLTNQGQPEDAIHHGRRALTLNPHYVEAHINLGLALQACGRIEEAADSFRQALTLAPDHGLALSNLGTALEAQGKIDEAVACYERALERKPHWPEARLNLSLAWLSAGDYERGWAEYEWRLQCAGAEQREFRRPRWDGSSLKGRTILLHSEQGFGDTIQFVRYADVLRRDGARVIVECQSSLRLLLSRCIGIDQVISTGDAWPEFDVHAPLMSLPSILGTKLNSVPANVPYLQADPQLVEAWRQKLQDVSGFKIGICWQGSQKYRLDRFRSIPLVEFAALAEISDVRLVSLQKGFGVEQLGKIPSSMRVEDWGSRLDDVHGPFIDTAAILSSLDLVVTCDSALGHLAGALGVPVWVALPVVSDWRWIRGRQDSPWYPTLRLFQQTKLGDWAGVFRAMRETLETQLAARRHRSMSNGVPS